VIGCSAAWTVRPVPRSTNRRCDHGSFVDRRNPCRVDSVRTADSPLALDAGFVGYHFLRGIIDSGCEVLLRVGSNVRLLQQLGFARGYAGSGEGRNGVAGNRKIPHGGRKTPSVLFRQVFNAWLITVALGLLAYRDSMTVLRDRPCLYANASTCPKSSPGNPTGGKPFASRSAAMA